MYPSVRSSMLGSAFVVTLLAAAPAAAAPAAAEPAAAEPQPSETQKQFQAIQWTQGPAKVGIGGHAEIQVPEGFAYTGASGAQKLLELMHNPTSGTELGILTDKDLDIFVLFEFEDIGYVKDAEKEKLDGDDILKSITGRERIVQRGAQGARLAGDHDRRLAHAPVLQP